MPLIAGNLPLSCSPGSCLNCSNAFMSQVNDCQVQFYVRRSKNPHLFAHLFHCVKSTPSSGLN